MVAPLIVGGALLGAGWLGGKSASGSVEILTNKKQQTDVNVIAPFAPFIFQPTTDTTNTNTYIISSPNSSVNTSTKKETTGATAPISYSLPIDVSPAQSSGSEGSSFDFMTPLVIAGFIAGGYFLLNGGKK